jgi:opacity protein-like surface antigen
MRKKFAAAACAALITALTAGPALAGEVQGPPGAANQPGTYTPVHFGVAASECSFNGLNDFQQGQQLRITQNYGTNLQLGYGRSLGFPGTDCNPTRG